MPYDLNGEDVTIGNVTSEYVGGAGFYLFYAVLSAVASLAALIILVAVLALLLGKLGLSNIIKLK